MTANMDHNESTILSFEMSYEDFTSVNVPVSVFIIVMNIFFIYCMVFQQSEQEQLKQPLNVLQGILVGCNIAISVCMLLQVCIHVFPPCWVCLPKIVSNCVVYTMMTSVTSSFWQNVFYYCQITPVQSYFIWLKKNICVCIYCALLISVTIYLFGLSLVIVIIVILQSTASKNGTSTVPVSYSIFMNIALIWYLVYSMTLGLLILNLCGMSTSSCATVIYLWKHLKNMERNNTLSSPRFQRQIRMTIRSIGMHAVLHFICSLGVVVHLYVSMYSDVNYDPNEHILCTIVSYYALGTTITLVIAQALFRQQVAYAWNFFFSNF